MHHSIKFRIPDELNDWLAGSAERSGLSRGQFIRKVLEQARREEQQPFLRLAGVMSGPRDLSKREGFFTQTGINATHIRGPRGRQ